MSKIIENHLNDDVNNLSKWSCENELIMYLKKGNQRRCFLALNLLNGRKLNVQVGGTCINCATTYKYLGVTLDASLNLESGFNATYKKAAGRLNLLRRI